MAAESRSRKETEPPVSAKLAELGLNASNSVVIGSGIMEALGIRPSNDIDLVIAGTAYESLKGRGHFTEKTTHGRPILDDGIFEIGVAWTVLGQEMELRDLKKRSIIINDVRYITLEFLLAVKKSWSAGDNVRQKDKDDIRLIERYLQKYSDQLNRRVDD